VERRRILSARSARYCRGDAVTLTHLSGPSRRAVIAGAVNTASAALLAPLLTSIAEAQGPTAMHTRPIPSSGEAMPVIGVGTWQAFDVGMSAAELAPRREVLDILFAVGGRMIDSSPMYGRAEAVVGHLLSDMKARDKAFLATKVWTSGEAAGQTQMQSSADKMRTRTIDLMQIHNLVDWRTQLRSLRAGKEQGRFRYIGITHYTVSGIDDLADIIRTEKIDFVQLAYSLGVRDAETKLLPLAAERGVAVIPNRPFEGGSLFAKVRGRPLPDWASEIEARSWSEVFLKYLVGNPAVTCVIPGTAKPAHMRDNVAAGIGPLPDEAMRRRMAQWWDAL
jgi:diketogulonate reductase-like aldo/keto reductase